MTNGSLDGFSNDYRVQVGIKTKRMIEKVLIHEQSSLGLHVGMDLCELLTRSALSVFTTAPERTEVTSPTVVTSSGNIVGVFLSKIAEFGASSLWNVQIQVSVSRIESTQKDFSKDLNVLLKTEWIEHGKFSTKLIDFSRVMAAFDETRHLRALGGSVERRERKREERRFACSRRSELCQATIQ